ncbi:uncharacterized protein [Lepeophtheirus salmonis]|uniref:uncharacterized protein n=1 Tax=Lepeophtheirus salmonis TaxID=72036 RepID=UPI003AF380B7
MSGEMNNMLVSTTVKDSFFDDPFFKDWWNDFDVPMQSYNKTFNRQISETPRRSLLDSFFDLKSGKSIGTASSSTSTKASALSLQNGKFTIRIDIGDFDPEDLDIKVEEDVLFVIGEREIKRGNFVVAKSSFNQKFNLPKGIDVDNITSELHFGGKLVITAPQLVPQKVDPGEDPDQEVSKQGEKKTTVSEAEILLGKGGKGKSKSSETEDKQSKVSTVTRTLPDGSTVEETIEEEEVLYETSTSTEMSLSGVGGKRPSLMELQNMLKSGAASGVTSTTIANTNEKLKAQGGNIIEMTKEENTTDDIKEMIIPISIQGSGKAAITGPKSPKIPKPRFMPFSFPSSMNIPDPNEMMAKMHQQVQLQMEQMQKATMQKLQVPKQGSGQVSQSTPQNVTEELADQDFFVPLKDIGKVQRNALANAAAMAKMKDEHFELVVNIQKFTPEEVRVYVDTPQKFVLVKAVRKTSDGLITDSFERQFDLPEDVDPEKLTSGISRDGILMIRVPRRKSISQERVIPIQYDAKLDAVQQGVLKAVENSQTEMTSAQVQEELVREKITPLKIEKEEDKVKAASAEVIEALTVGVAEASGADAGEEAGTKASSLAAQKAVAEIVAKAVHEVAVSVGTEIAGELGAKAAIEAAITIGKHVGERSATYIGANVGREVGRISGAQAASIAAAEELAKMNLAELTEEKAITLKSKFAELGTKIGADAGTKAGTEAGKNIDPEIPVKEAKEAAAKAAEDAAMRVKALIDLANEEATAIGEEAGKIAGKAAGEIAGEKVAVESIVSVAVASAIEVAKAIIGETGITIGQSVGKKIGQEIAAKLGKELGAEVGQIAGKNVGIDEAIKIAKASVIEHGSTSLDESQINALKIKLAETVKAAATKSGTIAGEKAGKNINLEVILAEAVAAASKAAEEQALEVKAFEAMGSEIAEESGKKIWRRRGCRIRINCWRESCYRSCNETIY